ncbi:Pfam:DUF1742 [Geosmithia morbida]|uniref:Pfam:DUF1742 n=1 Tax=Geosmithia morbida TaxID=1094350 RepID=A0A9P4YT37_9HYPO|nr:Pfam:DUF1742 [Geosmithia morbida]KAF4122037.1 Pfam:DUF1742 [Geosmithia morbida]
MSGAPFPNVYTHRKVAESSAKACDVCYKPSSSVLITPDKKDRYFCTPKVDEEAEKARRDRELAEETEKLKREYEEKQRKKKEKSEEDRKDDADKKEDDGKKDSGKKGDESTKPDKKSPKEKESPEPEKEEPRVFELKSPFYQQRLQRKRQAEAAKRDRERVSQPNYFPSVPTDLPTK